VKWSLSNKFDVDDVKVIGIVHVPSGAPDYLTEDEFLDDFVKKSLVDCSFSWLTPP
jgi:hypothetical protein